MSFFYHTNTPHSHIYYISRRRASLLTKRKYGYIIYVLSYYFHIKYFLLHFAFNTSRVGVVHKYCCFALPTCLVILFRMACSINNVFLLLFFIQFV